MNRLIDLVTFIGFKYDNHPNIDGYVYYMDGDRFYLGLPETIPIKYAPDCMNMIVKNLENEIVFTITIYSYNWEQDIYFENNDDGIRKCLEFVMKIKEFKTIIRKYKIEKLLNG